MQQEVYSREVNHVEESVRVCDPGGSTAPGGNMGCLR